MFFFSRDPDVLNRKAAMCSLLRVKKCDWCVERRTSVMSPHVPRALHVSVCRHIGHDTVSALNTNMGMQWNESQHYMWQYSEICVNIDSFIWKEKRDVSCLFDFLKAGIHILTWRLFVWWTENLHGYPRHAIVSVVWVLASFGPWTSVNSALLAIA